MHRLLRFEEFFVCPECAEPIMSKEELQSRRGSELRFCLHCRQDIKSAYEEAINSMDLPF